MLANVPVWGFCEAPGVFSEMCQIALGGRDDAGQSYRDYTVECGEDLKPLLDMSSRTDLGIFTIQKSLSYLLL